MISCLEVFSICLHILAAFVFSVVGIIYDKIDKFVELDRPISVSVKFLEQTLEEASVYADLKARHKGSQLVDSEYPISVEVKFTEDVPEDELFRAAIGEVKEFVAEGLGQVLELLFGNLAVVVFGDAPHAFHHLHEVEVRRHRHWQVGVVVAPLSATDLAVPISFDSFKSLEEVFENLFSGKFSLNKVLILRDIIDGVDVCNGDLPRLILVHQSESFVNDGFSAVT